ncbi:hypothetical protein [Aquimarina algiphila]|uniref:hypothetical protein n=1 Tax=Aquimarina algiphila TaxID=2047982 RepID=UPI00232BEE47|nr:hypothetical protein [Aquimarina algiphila]
MKKTILTIFLSAVLLSAFSCKKDPKSDTLDTVEVARGDTSDFVEEVDKEKEPEVEKKKKPNKKKKSDLDGKKDFEKTNKLIPIPGTSGYTKNSAAKKYIKDYEKYVANYKKAVEAHDMESFLKLNEASSDLTKQYNSLMTKLSGEEIENISKYMQAKSKQLNALSAKM